VTRRENPLGALVLKRKTCADRKLSREHVMSAKYGALNLPLRQDMGAAQADIKRLMTDTQHTIDWFSLSSYSRLTYCCMVGQIIKRSTSEV
jgi:hypothetical protein